MDESENDVLPQGWSAQSIESCVQLNPKIDKKEISDDKLVHFVPMPAVSAKTNEIDISQTRQFLEVKKGYTAFTSSDVLFAKITPCMENGKMCIVPNLKHDLALGSTEFHVLRASGAIAPEWLYYYVSSDFFRYEAEHNMTGAVGQRRVPIKFIGDHKFSLPPLAEQKRIVTKIEELFSELDAGEESFKQARKQLGIYRQSLLKQAFEGKLTEAWRKANPDQLEAPDQLLARIQQERESRHQQQLTDWQQAVEQWEQNGKKGKKPAKPKPPQSVSGFNSLEIIPEKWACVPIGDCCSEALIGLVRSANLQNSTPSGLRYLKMDRIDMEGNVSTSPDVYVACSKDEETRFQLNLGDILFNTRNSVELVGKTAVVRSLPVDPVVYNNNLMRLRFPPSIDPNFINSQMCSSVFRNQMEQIKKATTSVAAVYGKDLWPIALCVPSLPEQQEIVRLLEEQFTVIEQNEREIDAALKRSEALRQSILKRAFSGQLVPQDPTDEPASQLLTRIQAERTEQEAKEKATKKAKKKKAKKKTARKRVK